MIENDNIVKRILKKYRPIQPKSEFEKEMG